MLTLFPKPVCLTVETGSTLLLSLCLSSLCMQYCARTSGEPDPLSLRIQSTREDEPNLYNSRNSFLES